MAFSIAAFLVNALIATAISAAVGFLGRPNGKDRRSDGFGFFLRRNSGDPSDPIVVAYGAPQWAPTTLFRYLEPSALNSTSPSKGEKLVTGLSLGAGPIDGGDFSVWLNDQKLVAEVDADSADNERTLKPIGDERRTFEFPASNVIESSVELFVDGELYAKANAAGTVATVNSLEATSQAVTLSRFGDSDASDVTKDSDAKSPRYLQRIGAIPQDRVDRTTLKLTIITRGVQAIRFASGRTSTSTVHLVRTKDIAWGTTDAGEDYFYIRSDDINGLFADGKLWIVRAYYKYYSRADVEFVKKPDGTSTVVFSQPVGASAAVTANYKTSLSPDDDGVTFTLRHGETHQDALPTGSALRQTRLVGTELTEGTARTYSTQSEVDDVVIGIEAPNGFFDRAVHGRNAGDYRPTTRNVQIRLRQQGAADSVTTSGDPSRAWVPLVLPSDPTETTITLRANSDGLTRWFFSVADMLAAVRKRDPEPLRRALYEVEVTALDPANTVGGEVLDRVTDNLFFGNATEVVASRLSLPRHATATVQINDPKTIPQEPTFRVGVMGRKVWVPESTATLNTDSGLPEPGEWVWTRNPVWCACDLVTDEDFGAGKFYGWANVDLASAIAAAAHCDETVDGETRAELDYVVSRRSNLLDHVAQMLAGAEVIPVLSGGTWQFVIDEDASSVMALTDDDIEEGQVSASYPSIEETPNVVEASFTNETLGHERDSETVRVPDLEPSQTVTRPLDLSGVRRRSQVRRSASLYLRQWYQQRVQVDLVAASWRPLALEAGDIVTLTSTSLGYTAKKFRVVYVGWGSNLRVVLQLTEHVPAAYTGEIPVDTAATTSRVAASTVTAAPILFPQLSVERIHA